MNSVTGEATTTCPDEKQLKAKERKPPAPKPRADAKDAAHGTGAAVYHSREYEVRRSAREHARARASRARMVARKLSRARLSAICHVSFAQDLVRMLEDLDKGKKPRRPKSAMR